MRSLKSLVVAAFAVLTLIFLLPATPANAQEPAYLRAISNLRTAKAYLGMDTRPAFRGDRIVAIQEIDAAIGEMQRAAVDDGRNPWHTPPPQSGSDPLGPVHSAMRLMNEALGDVERGGDNPRNAGLQARSIHHVKQAQARLQPWM
jgi:hypothetical protein